MSSVEAARVVGGITTVSRRADRLAWHVDWILSVDDQGLGSPPVRIRLAVPLPAGEILEPAAGVEPEIENGRIVAVVVDPQAIVGRIASATFLQPIAPVVKGSLATGDFVLGAPIASGAALQIVDGNLGVDGTRIDVTPRGALAQHVGFVASPAVSHAARVEARRLTGRDRTIAGSTAYVRGTDVEAVSGLVGHVTSDREVAQKVTVPVALIFGAIVIALVVFLRKLKGAAEIERADAILVREIERGSAT